MQAFGPHESKKDFSAKIFLKNQQGIIVAQSNTGILEINNLLPGTYDASFEQKSAFHNPETIRITANPNEHLGPYNVTYSHKVGSVVVSYSTGEQEDKLRDITFTLKTPQNETLSFSGRCRAG